MEGMMGDCADLANITSRNCSVLSMYENCTDELGDVCQISAGTCEAEPDLYKGVSIIVLTAMSLFGNICTILILSQFKIHKIPDVLVIGLAITDLLATIPISAAMYAYFAGVDFINGCILCDFMGTIAQFTRYSSAVIVSLVSLERYFAVNRPFVYRKHATPKLFVKILIFCWLLSLGIATIPVIGKNTAILTNDGVCLFEITSNYAIGILIFSAINYVIVFVCFVLVTVELCKVYRRRQRLKVQGEYNNNSNARTRTRELTFTRPNITSRISDLGKTIKAAAPIITEKFQLGVEAQFARMLFAVVALFYINWTTVVVVIVIAQIKQEFAGLEEALFWGLRLTVISTAINPLLYGILARQYRLAYYYVVRLWFSKCFCCCIDPPLKDVFAAARNLGGEVQETRRGSQSRYGTQRSGGSSAGGKYTIKPSLNILLTNSTHLGVNIALPPRLSQIHEEMSLEPSDTTAAAEFSTHVPTAGELSSSVIIPFQARDHNDSSTVDLEMRGAASMHDLVDAGMVELGNTTNPHSGIENPLAIMTKIIGGEEVIISPGESLESGEAHTEFCSPQFTNPAYEISSNSTSPRTREQMEADIANRQHMLAASSTDDITLISKKRKVAKTRSSETPYRYSDSNLTSEGPSRRNKGLKLPLSHISRVNHQSYTALQDERELNVVSPLQQSQRNSGAVTATDIDTGQSILVASRDNLDNQPSNQTVILVPNRNNKASSCSPSHSVGPTPPTLKTIQAHAHSRSFDATTMLEEQGSKDKHRNNLNHEKHGGTKEVGLPAPPLCHTRNGHHSRSQNGTGRRNSTENSDSGRESMVLD